MVSAQAGNRSRGEGYLFFAPTVGSESAVHMGGGGEGFVYKGLGAELGYLGRWSGFTVNEMGIGSADVSYHFMPGRNHPAVEPFVTGGYSLFLPARIASGVNFGGGVNIWMAKHAGLRLEIRDQVTPDPVACCARGTNQFVDFRIGLAFR